MIALLCDINIAHIDTVMMTHLRYNVQPLVVTHISLTAKMPTLNFFDIPLLGHLQALSYSNMQLMMELVFH